MKLPNIVSALRGLVTPPFLGLPAVAWIYFIFCFLIHPGSRILQGNLADPDDYMYLAQAIDWLNGQGWFDNIQYRLDPPQGTPIHYSRLAQVPLAATIALLRPLLGVTGAGLVTAALWPLVWFGCLFAALAWAAKPFTGSDWTRVTAFVALFSPALMLLYIPGHIDHHGLQAVIMVLALGCAARMIGKERDLRSAAGAGFFLAFGLLIGLESLPWLILFSAFTGLWAMEKGGNAARTGFFFSLSLLISSLAFLATVQPPGKWLAPEMLELSIVYVTLIASIALCFTGIAAAAQTKYIWLRWAAGIGLALITGAAFFYHFPQLLSGPYGAVTPGIAEMTRAFVSEALPLLRPGHWGMGLLAAAQPLLGFGAVVWILRTERKQRWPWGLVAVLLGAAIPLALFYQTRVLAFAQLFALIPLVFLVKKAKPRLGFLLLAGPLLGVLIPALFDGRAFNTGVLLFPVGQTENVCDAKVLAQLLGTRYGDRPRIIMNGMNEGPELLFRTPYKVLSASTFDNVRGMTDATAFFKARDPAGAEKIARRRGAEFIVMCRMLSDVYRTSPANRVTFDERGKTVMDAKASFAERLADGHTPSWLRQISFPLLGNMMLFEVLPKKRGMIE